MSTLDATCTALVTYGAFHLARRRADFDGVMCTEMTLDGPVSFSGDVGRLGIVFDTLWDLGVRRPWLTVDEGRAAVALAGDLSGMWTGSLDAMDDGGRGVSFRASLRWRDVPGLVPERPSLDAAHTALREAFVAVTALPARVDSLWAPALRSALAGEPAELYPRVVPVGYPAAARDVAHGAMWALDIASRLLARAPEATPADHRAAAQALRAAMLGGLVAAANADL